MKERFLHTKQVHKWLQMNDVTLQFLLEVGLSLPLILHSTTQLVTASFNPNISLPY